MSAILTQPSTAALSRTRPAARRARALLTSCLILVLASGGPAQAQATEGQAAPAVGQPGKDVMWLPTPPELVSKMLEMAEVSSRDVVMDLGSGDGRTVIAAASLGARAIGAEYDPALVELSKINAEEAGVADRAAFMKADLFTIDLSQATVITTFLLPELEATEGPTAMPRPAYRIATGWCRWHPASPVHPTAVEVQERVDVEALL